METKDNRTLGLDVLTTIFMEMEQITPEQVEKNAAMTLDKIERGSEKLGVLTDINARKMWVIVKRYSSRAVEFRGREAGAEDEEQRREYESEAWRFKTLAEVARAIFWAEVDATVGDWKSNLGIRAGWVIVRNKDDDNPLKKLLGGLGIESE